MMNIFKNKLSAIWLLAALFVAPALVSCDDDDDNNDGADPVVRYFRTTYAEKADSMIVAGSLGQVIAIIGENLSNVTAIKFNDREATLNPCYITNTALIVTIPSGIPTEITNKVYMTSKNGNTTEFDFEAAIPAPVISNLSSLVFAEGQTLTFTGNFFVETPEQPIKVNFPGGASVEVTSPNYRTIRCEVPEGAAQTGSVSISTAYGVTNYMYKVNDIYGATVDNMYANMDDKNLEIWCSDKATVTDANDPVSGNYLSYVQPGANAWNWGNPFGTTSNLSAPLDYKITSNTCLAFEIRTNAPWTTSSPMSFQFGSAMAGSWETDMLMWAPWAETGTFATNGEWQTVLVPLSTGLMDKTGADISKTADPEEVLKGFCVMFWGQYTGTDGSLSCDIDVDFDNFRLLEK